MGKEKYVAYVGTYTHENSLGIHIYDVDVENAEITERKMVPISNSSDVIISHNGKILYSIADEGVEAFHIKEDGDLETINKKMIGGMRGCYLELDRDDRYLFVAGYHDARVSMMRLNKDGSIAGIADGVFHKGMGRCIAERNSRPHVHCVKVTPDQKFLCAVDGGLDHIKIYRLDYEGGQLIHHDILRCPLDSAPRAMRFSKDGQFAYVLCELSNVVNVYRYYVSENDNPEFEKIQSISTQDPGEDEVCSATTMEFSPDGRYLFCTDAGINAVLIFEVDKQTGKLSLVCNNRIGGEFPKAIAVFPDGKHFMCLNHDSNSIGIFSMNYEGNYFLMHGKPVEVETPNCVYIHKLDPETERRERHGREIPTGNKE